MNTNTQLAAGRALNQRPKPSGDGRDETRFKVSTDELSNQLRRHENAAET